MNRKYKIILLLSIMVISWVFIFFSFMYGKVHVLKKYNAETKETTIFEYIIEDGDTILHGEFTRYNKVGKKITEGNFTNGEISGENIYYFETGIIKSIYYYKRNKIPEENIDNFPSGKIMSYTLYDDLGMSAFIIRFDEKGNVKNHEGYPLLEIYQSKIANKEKFKTKTNQYLKVGDTLKQQYLIAYIPNAKRSVHIENIDADDAKAKGTLKKTSQTRIDVEEILINKGINRIRAVVKYEFNDKEKTVINDMIFFEVKVN
ncbi:hypothetical protein [Flavobacterium sp.]|uniref:hypothetical protein n=1 Tax=Flavobacterium sp. TaxID=239 RepID=UPI003D12C330